MTELPPECSARNLGCDERWTLWIDIEGFRDYYHTGQGERAKRLLFDLTDDLFTLGNLVFPTDSDRLFVHQFGDGFLVCPNPGCSVSYLPRALAIAIALLRSTLIRGGTARAAISSGEMANISGCLSEEIQTIRDHSHLELGSGLMTIQTVLGEGLVNAYGLWGSKPRGPHLLVDCKMEEKLHECEVVQLGKSDQGNGILVDWIRTTSVLAEEILRKIKRPSCEQTSLLANLKDYISGRDRLPRGGSDAESWSSWKKDTQTTLLRSPD